MSRPLALAAAGLTAFAVAARPVASPAARQVRVVDDGSFTVTRSDGTGREDFRIVQTPGASGPVYVATGTASFGDRRLVPALRTDTAGVALAYQLEVKVGGQTEERLRGIFGSRRFSATIQTPRGESAREYVVAEDALILDDDLFHQYYFLARAARTGQVAVVLPRRSAQVMTTVTDRGAESLTVGGDAYRARHLSVSVGSEERNVWVDAAGRVLKVTIPSRGVVALRDTPLPAPQ
jgi:hypothetical protein